MTNYNTPFDEEFWTTRYLNNETAWDIGQASPALIDFTNNNCQKDAQILIPGGGNAHEALMLLELGFKNVHVLDISKIPLQRLADKGYPKELLIHQDFFNHEGRYDLILEQTFFCALHPGLRTKYTKKVSQLLLEDGQVAGLLFDVPLNHDRPPFGGNAQVYEPIFSLHFKNISIKSCNNSIPQRMGKELFFTLSNKS